MKKTMLGVSVAVGIVALGASVLITKPTALSVDNKIANATVMITGMNERSGGTGVTIAATSDGSRVITNAHVCSLIKNGGKITSSSGKVSLATRYYLSEDHDLCAIDIADKLDNVATIGSEEPSRFESAIISGHPSLLPITVTNGHFGDKTVIQVLTKVDKCTAEDIKGDLALFCFFFGGIPVITTYQSQFVTATIMAGSSGSGVYNSKGHLVGIAFAGSGEIGYAHTVPFTYMTDFIYGLYKVPENTWKKPNYSANIRELLLEEQMTSDRNSLADKCKTEKNTKSEINKVCKIITDTVK